MDEDWPGSVGWAQSYAEWWEWMKDKPLLCRLREERIFSVGPARDGRLGFMEECDAHFGVLLTREEVRQLADELRMAADAPSSQS